MPAAMSFNPDGTVAVDLPSGKVTLRPPTIGEWRLLFSLYDAADNQLTSTPDADRAAALWLDEANPYAVAFAETIGLLSDTATPDADRLPLWCGVPGIFARLYQHWRVVDFKYVDTDDPFRPQPVEEPVENVPDIVVTDTSVNTAPIEERPAATAPIPPVDLDELTATAPVPATGGITNRGEQNMG